MQNHPLWQPHKSNFLQHHGQFTSIFSQRPMQDARKCALWSSTWSCLPPALVNHARPAMSFKLSLTFGTDLDDSQLFPHLHLGPTVVLLLPLVRGIPSTSFPRQKQAKTQLSECLQPSLWSEQDQTAHFLLPFLIYWSPNPSWPGLAWPSNSLITRQWEVFPDSSYHNFTSL